MSREGLPPRPRNCAQFSDSSQRSIHRILILPTWIPSHHVSVCLRRSVCEAAIHCAAI